jgi:hypothetical protein
MVTLTVGAADLHELPVSFVTSDPGDVPRVVQVPEPELMPVESAALLYSVVSDGRQVGLLHVGREVNPTFERSYQRVREIVSERHTRRQKRFFYADGSPLLP